MNTSHLTYEQRAIVSQRAGAILIGAVAGSGKTTTLAHCVAHALRGGTAPEDVLVLVFTRAAQEVFRARLAQAGASRKVKVATYAEFAAELLDGWRTNGLIDGARAWLPDARAARDGLFEAIELAAEDAPDPDYDYTLSAEHAETLLNHLSRLKGTLELRRFEDESNAELADGLDLPRGLVGVCRQYEALRHVDLGSWAWQSEPDLVFDTLDVLDRMGEQLTLPRYALIVADEWHDANAGHLALLERLAGEGGRVVAAGDREQVIHSWNGADPRFMGEAYLAAFPGTRRMPLTLSFRCGPTLAACAEAVSRQPFGSARTEDTAVRVLGYDAADPGDAARQLVQTVADLNGPQHEVRLGDIAVLLREPYQGIAIENALIDAGIPYRVEGFKPYLDRTEIRMLRGLLHVAEESIALAGGNDEVKAIVRALGRLTILPYSPQEWQRAEAEILADPERSWKYYLAQMRRVRQSETDTEVDMRRRAQVARVCDELLAHRADWTAGQLLAHAAEALRLGDTIKRWVVRRDEAAAIARSIAGFIAYAAHAGLSAHDFLAHLDGVQQRAAALHKRQGERLALLTARDAKGKEWAQVLLPGLVDGDFPAAYAEQGEERRLFYVAITRAVDGLHLFVPRGQRNRFVDAMGLPAAQAASAGRLRERREEVEAPPLRTYLEVPFAEKDEAKALGAQWDAVARKWWVGPGVPLRNVAKWRGKAG